MQPQTKRRRTVVGPTLPQVRGPGDNCEGNAWGPGASLSRLDMGLKELLQVTSDDGRGWWQEMTSSAREKTGAAAKPATSQSVDDDGWWSLQPEERKLTKAGEEMVKTSWRYRAALDRLLNWAEKMKLRIGTREQLDYAGYLYCEVVRAEGDPKTWGTILASAVKFYDPESRPYGWPWMEAGKKILERAHPVESHAPAVLSVCVGIAVELRRRGKVDRAPASVSDAWRVA